ncbi:MAG: hypothetical protein A2X58_10435 [Nitrospirae bacterium GWC2_56_14]|nr:MAG: hypothetical protein A2X58_10435 [Nitrospirae bacterium GWC2_56_14]
MTFSQLKEPWIGEIPAEWGLTAIKRLVSVKITDGPHETPELDDDGIQFISAEAIKNNQIDFNLRRGFISPELHELYCRKCKPQKNDIFVIKSGATTGNVAYVNVDFEFSIWSPLALIRCDERLAFYKFVFYVLLSEVFRKQIELSWSFGTQQNIGMGVIERLKVPLPSLPEQQRIAAYLDTSCVAIDAAVAAKRQQLETLDTLAAAIIHQVVTQGLDLNVKKKPSGLDWLTEVPEHWQEKQIKRMCSLVRGQFTHRPRNDPALYDGPHPFVQTGDITSAKKYIMTYSQTLNELGLSVSKRFPRGTLVMSIAANIGDVAILDFEACFPDSMIGMIPGHKTNLDYLYYLMRAMKSIMLRSAVLSTQLNLNYVRIGTNFAAFPPKKEQEEIAEYLDAKEKDVLAVKETLNQQISTLLAYRKSLIHECVTGQKRITEADVKHLTMTTN